MAFACFRLIAGLGVGGPEGIGVMGVGANGVDWRRQPAWRSADGRNGQPLLVDVVGLLRNVSKAAGATIPR